jgi:hypothetical protein
MQTLQNGIEVFTNSDEYDLATDVANAFDDANVVVVVADAGARNALLKSAGMPVYRLDTARMEIWNGSRWAVPATTERGHDYTTPSTIAGVAYATVAAVTFVSLGGKLKLTYTGVVENANSGSNRTADVQWLVDGADFGGVTYNVPLVSGFDNPATAVAMVRELTIGAGTHTIALQTRANAAGAERNVLFSLTVTENP